MIFLWVLLSLIVVVLILIAFIPLKVLLNVNDELNFKLNFSWLSSFVTGTLKKQSHGMFLNIYLMKKQIIKKQLGVKKKKGSSIEMIKQIKPTYVSIHTSYGFNDPATTGVIYSLVNVISNYFNVDYIENEADFNCENSYFNLDSFAKINIIVTAFKLLKYHKKHPSTKVSYGS